MPLRPSMSRPRRRAVLLLLALLPAALAAQHEGHGVAAADTAPAWDAPIPLYGAAARGTFARRVSTRSAEAQAYVDQGFAAMWAFDLPAARRSFRAAWRRDTLCAACFWAEAWSWGSYLNEPMGAGEMPQAHAAIARAQALAPRASAVERALIAALARRYVPAWDSAPAQRARDTAYAAAMRDVARRFPRDAEAQTLFAEALMLLEPRRGPYPMAKPSVRELTAALEGVLRRDARHPGACHLYIHATELTERPERALPCAEHLGGAIPRASHINHMPSHTWNRTGHWGRSVRANLAAWHSDLRAAPEGGFAVYPGHNLHMLVFAASMDGQGAVAAQAARDLAKLSPALRSLHALALLRFGRFDEVLAVPAPRPHPVHAGLWTFARGYAWLRLDSLDAARAALATVDSLRAATPDSVTFRGHTAQQLLGITGDLLRGELDRQAGRLDAAIAAFARATALEDSLRYDEPEPLNFSARHWYGAALLEAGRAAEAEAVYGRALADHPNTGWVLVGLAQAQRAQGKAAAAARTAAAFRAAWARADTWIGSSRF